MGVLLADEVTPAAATTTKEPASKPTAEPTKETTLEPGIAPTISTDPIPASPPPTAKTPAPAASEPAAPSAKEEKKEETKPEPKLQFNFRFQRWVDVLEWVAEQADLSLVLDAPPPGTFNYSDSRKYTPTEAIDLINGVLLTKGYTLLRRERMLVVINLADGLPEGLVQRIDKKDLDKRGRFEMVSVLFPLGGRNVEEVHAEITPLLSPYGKSVPLPKTNQLLVTDTAGIMKTLDETIQAIPTGQQKPQNHGEGKPQKKQPQPVPTFQTYPITSADPKVVQEVIKALLPDAKVVFDPQMRQLNAYLLPAQHELVKSLLGQMQSEQAGDNKPSLQSYRLPNISRKGGNGNGGPDWKEFRRAEFLKEGLATIVPDAKMTFDPRTGKLVAWASPQDHETLRQAISQMGGHTSGLSEKASDLQSYSLRRGPEAEAAITTLKALLPEVEMHYSPISSKLVTIIDKETADLIKKTLTTLKVLIDQPVAANESPQIRYYAVPNGTPATLIEALREVAPGANASLDPTGKRLMIVGTSSDHAAVTEALQTIRESAKPLERQFKPYTIDRLDSTQITTTIQQAVPDATASVDPRTGRLLVLADPAGHEKIVQILKAMVENRTPGSMRQLEIHKTTTADLATILNVLKQIAPDAQITSDAKSGSLVVFAMPEDQALIRSTLERLSEKSVAEQNTLATYRVTPDQEKRFLALAPSLKTEMPDVMVLPDDDPETLAIWAKPKQHAAIKQMISVLNIEASDAAKRLFVAYPFRTTDATQTIEIIKNLFPATKVVYDQRTRQLVVWASAEEHETISSMINQLSPGSTSNSANGNAGIEKMAIYSIKESTPPVIQQVLEEIAPGVRSTINHKSQAVVVWATDAEHKKIKRAMEQLRTVADDPDKPILKIYSAGSSDATTLSKEIPRMFPKAKFLPDEASNSIRVYATPDEQKEIAEVFQSFQEVADVDNPLELVAYTLKGGQATKVLPALRQQVPIAKIAEGLQPDEILAWARQEDHKTIQKTIDLLNASAKQQAENVPTAVVYPLENTRATQAISVLRTAFPQIAMTQGSDPYKLIAVARSEDHELLKAAIEQMLKAPSGREQVKSIVYPFNSRINPQLVTTLRQTFERASFAIGSDHHSLLVWARDADQVKIKEMVDQLDTPEPLENAPKAQIFKLKRTTASSVIQVLRPMYEDANFSAGQTPDELIVMARPEDMKRIEAAISKMTTTDDPDDKPKMQAHPIDTADSARLFQMLQAFYHTRADVQVSLDAKNNAIVAIARQEDHAQIDEMIKQIESSTSPEVARPVKSYSMENIDANSLMDVLNTLLEDQKQTVSLTYYPKNRQLLAIAREKQHAIIEKAIEDMRGEAKTLEILNFEEVAPSTAKMAIEKNFADETGRLAPDAPLVDLDEQSDQLFVRATAKQHEEIRKLLIRMGETSMQGTEALNTRTIPFSEDVEVILRRVREVWPTMEQNPIHIGSPPSKEETETPKPDSTQLWGAKLLTVSTSEEDKEKEDKENEKKTLDPIYLVPSGKSITVRCEDPQALAKMEKLLRSMSSVKSIGGKDIQVFMLKYSDAQQLAPKLEDMAWEMAGPDWWDSRHAVVLSDRRLNAIIVQGTRKEREIIGQLIEFLDTNDFPKTLPFNEPTILPIVNTSAGDVEDVIYDVFRDRLARRSRGESSYYWRDSNTAKVVTEETSNSLIIIAQEPLRAQIIEMAKKLDAAATAETVNTVRLIPLKNLNASKAEQLLKATQGSSRRSSRRSSSRRSGPPQ